MNGDKKMGTSLKLTRRQFVVLSAVTLSGARTPRWPQGARRFVQLTDLHISVRHPGSRQHLDQLARQIIREKPDFLLDTGDITDYADAGSAEIYKKHIFNPIREAGIPFRYVSGNHDNPDVLARVFGTKAENTFFTFAGYNFFMIDFWPTPRLFNRADWQRQLVELFRRGAGKPVFIVIHPPPIIAEWSSRGGEILERLLQTIRTYHGMVVWICGHDHHNHVLFEPQQLGSNRGSKTAGFPDKLRLPDNLLVVASGAAETRLWYSAHYPVGYRVWVVRPGRLESWFQPILSEGAARYGPAWFKHGMYRPDPGILRCFAFDFARRFHRRLDAGECGFRKLYKPLDLGEHVAGGLSLGEPAGATAIIWHNRKGRNVELTLRVGDKKFKEIEYDEAAKTVAPENGLIRLRLKYHKPIRLAGFAGRPALVRVSEAPAPVSKETPKAEVSR